MTLVKWMKQDAVLVRDCMTLFIFAIFIFYLESLAWPIHPGRDMGTYLAYYVDFFNKDPFYYFLMVFRTPIAPFLIGWSNAIGGSLFLEFVQGVFFAGTILFVYLIGYGWGRRIALCLGIVLTAYPPFALLYHQVSSDCYFAFGFTVWSWWVVKTLRNPTPRMFVICGAGVFLLALIRPGSQMLMIFCFAPLLLPKILVPRRIVLSAAFLCTCIILIMAWSLHNYLRYDDFTLSRGASACIPLYRLWTVNKVVHPDNGPVSMELGVAVRKDLLRREPYVSYGISEERFFSSGSTRMWSDLVSLSDRTWGWSDNYRHLRLVAMEALRQHWIPYARELILNYYNIMMMPGDVPHAVLRNSPQGEKSLKTITVQGKELPAPSEGQPIPHAYLNFTQSNPRNLPATHEDRKRFSEKIDALGLHIPEKEGSVFFAARLKNLTAAWPPMLVFVLLGVGGTVLIPSWKLYPLAVVTGLSMLIVFITLTGMTVAIEYRIPFDPIFIIFGIIGSIRIGNWLAEKKPVEKDR